MLIDVLVLNPKEIIFEGKAKSVKLPGEGGAFEVLPFHKPLLSRLVSGVLFVDEKSFSITRGIAKVKNNEAMIIIEE